MADPHCYQPTRRRLLRDATGAGASLAGVGLIGCEEAGSESAGAGASGAARPSCTLAAELTEGPFYIDLDKLRRDITEDRRGLRLDLRMRVVNAGTCRPMKDVAVEILARGRRRHLLRLQPGGDRGGHLSSRRPADR